MLKSEIGLVANGIQQIAAGANQFLAKSKHTDAGKEEVLDVSDSESVSVSSCESDDSELKEETYVFSDEEANEEDAKLKC